MQTALAFYALAANIENLAGSAAGGQTLNGNGLNNVISGGPGSDTLHGGGGS